MYIWFIGMVFIHTFFSEIFELGQQSENIWSSPNSDGNITQIRVKCHQTIETHT